MMICINGIIASIFLFVASKVNRGHDGKVRQGEYFWGWGTLVITIGVFLLGLQGRASPWLGVILANACLMAGYAFINFGIRLFIGRKAPWRHVAVLLAAYLAVIWVFTYLRPSAQLRVILFSAFSSVFIGECAFSSLAARHTVKGALPWACAAVFAVLAAFAAVRAILTASMPMVSIFQPATLNLVTFLLSGIGFIAWSFCLLLFRNTELNAELAGAEALYRGIFENANVGIFQSTEDGIYLRMNRRFADILGYPDPGALIKERGSASEWKFDDRPEQDRILALLRQEGHVENVHMTAPKRDGGMVHGLVNLAIVDQQGGRRILTGTVMDMTRSWLDGEALRRQSEEKGILLRELQHRVKNGMSIIASLVSLEAGRSGDEGTVGALTSLGDKVGALSSLYDLLYRSGDSREIDLAFYLGTIVDGLRSSYGLAERGVEMETGIEPIAVDAKRAESLGLIVVELLTDSIKHAFPGKRRGVIRLSLARSGDSTILEVSDDGVGLPPDFSVAGSTGLGMTIVDLLSSQLGGRLETGASPSGGASFRFVFP